MKWVEMSVRAAGVKERFEDGGESCCEGWLKTVEPEVAVFTFMTFSFRWEHLELSLRVEFPAGEWK